MGFVATVFAGQQVRDVTEFLWKSRLGPCAFHRASRTARGNAYTPPGFTLLCGAPANSTHHHRKYQDPFTALPPASICQRRPFARAAVKRLWLRLTSGVRVIVINRAPSARVYRSTYGSSEERLSSSLHTLVAMILSQISYLDCVAFLVFLTPQLLIQIGLFPVLKWLVPALPFIGEFAYRVSSRY